MPVILINSTIGLSFNYLSIGRCKSALHKFVVDTVDSIKNDKDQHSKNKGRTMLLPHSTWDKFGDILAHNGGKLFGLFDELISFFSTMNMYSSSKSSVQDNREYQDFLQLFTGKAKNRETSKNLFHANEKSASIPR